MKKLWVAEAKGRHGITLYFDRKDDLWKSLSFEPNHEHNTQTEEGLKLALEQYKCGQPVEAKMISGGYFPRIWRGSMTPPPHKLGAAATGQWVSNVRTTRMLYSKLGPLFAAIEPNADQDATYGLLQREILILACTEVESAWKTVLVQNNALPKGKYWNTQDYVRLLPTMRLDEWAVSLSSHHAYRVISPFSSWDPASPTSSLPWYDAYNAVKHGREDHLERATFGHAVDAVAAAFVMTVAQFGHAHLASYQTESEEAASNMHFHPDEFTIEREPYWQGIQCYLPPSNLGIERGEWLGYKEWTSVHCPELDDRSVP